MTTEAITPLRQRMIEDMNARKLGKDTQRGHVYSCKRLAAFLNRSPDIATAEDIRRFQLHLSETGTSICNRNRIMTGLRQKGREGPRIREPRVVAEELQLAGLVSDDELLQDQPAEQAGKHLDGEKEVGSAGHPARSIERDAAARQRRPSSLALAAAAPCASSRPSCAASNPSTAHRRCRSQSGSIPHD